MKSFMKIIISISLALTQSFGLTQATASDYKVPTAYNTSDVTKFPAGSAKLFFDTSLGSEFGITFKVPAEEFAKLPLGSTFELYQVDSNGEQVDLLIEYTGSFGDDFTGNIYRLTPEGKELISGEELNTLRSQHLDKLASESELRGSGGPVKGESSQGSGFGEAIGVATVVAGFIGGVDGLSQVGIQSAKTLKANLSSNQVAIAEWASKISEISSKIDVGLKAYEAAGAANLGQSFRDWNTETRFLDGLDEKFPGVLSNYPGAISPIAASANSKLGKILKSQDKDYQNYWKKTAGLKQLSKNKKILFYSGLSSLRQADNYLADGNADLTLKMSKMAGIYMDVLNGSLEGVAASFAEIGEGIDEVKNLGVSIIENINNPAKLKDMFTDYVKSLPDLKEQIEAEVLKNYEILKNGSAYERSKLISKITTDAVVDYVSGGLGRAVRSTKYAKRMANIINKTKTDLKDVISRAKKAEIDKLLSTAEVKKYYKQIGDSLIVKVPGMQRIAPGVWQSAEGLVYGPDKYYSNRFNHVLAHTKSVSKNVHTKFIFTEPSKVSSLLDESYRKAKSLDLIKDSKKQSIVVDLGREIGTQGETKLVLVLKDFNKVVTAYPEALQ